jgi:hypothetical protein
MCCGQKRSALQSGQIQAAQRSMAQRTPASAATQATGSVLASAATATKPPAGIASGGVSATRTSRGHGPVSNVSVRYVGNWPIRVRGQASRLYYEFSRSRPLQEVATRDAASLLRTHLFRRS